MAGGSKDLRYNVAVDASDASASLKKLGSDVKKTAKDIESSFDDSASAGDKFKATVDELSGKLESEFKSAAQAAEKLGDALKGAGSKMDVGTAVADLKQMGFTFDEITADADKFAASLKQLDDVKATGVKELDDVAPGLAKKLEDIDESSSGVRESLSSMVGGAGGELASLAGAGGLASQAIDGLSSAFYEGRSAGESVGQALRTVGRAVPLLLGVAGAMQIVTGFMNEQAAQAAASEARTKAFGDAMQGAADDTVGLADAIRANEADMRNFVRTADNAAEQAGLIFDKMASGLPLIGGFFSDQSVDVIDALDKAGISVYDFTKAVEEGGDGGFDFVDMLVSAQEQGLITAKQVEAVADNVRRYGDEQNKAAQATKLANVGQGEANDLLGEFLKKDKPLEQFQSTWKTLMDDMADGSINTEDAADAVNVLARELGLTQAEVIALAQAGLDKAMEDGAKAADEAAKATEEAGKKARETAAHMADLRRIMTGADWGAKTLEGAVSAMTDYSAQLFGLKNIHADAEAAFDGLAESVKKNGKSFDGNTDKSRANLAALEAVATSLDTKFSAAYVAADGNLDAFKKNAGEIADDTLKRLQKELGLSDAQTAALGKSLGLTEGDYVARFTLSGAAEAQAKLDLLNISLDDFDDPNARQAYMQAIVQGDYVLALQIAQTMAAGDRSVRYDVYTRYHVSGDRGSVGATPPEGFTGKAAPGVAPIAAQVTNTKTAQRQLDHLVAPRTARINVALVPSTVLVRVNGGG